MDDTIRLPELARELRKHGITTSYLQVWRWVVAGSIPAERIGSRWVVRASDLPAIAALFLQDAL